MSQSIEQMTTSLERLFSLQYFKDAEKPTYVQTIFEGCAWMDAHLFDAVVKEICKRIKTNQRQKPAHFIEMYKILAEQHGWHRKETRVCASCGGGGFVYIWVRDKKGHEFKATKGCAECNSKYNSLHPDFTEIQEPESVRAVDPRVNVRTIPPAMAQCLLGIADSARLNIPEDLLNDLVQAAAQPDAKSYLPIKGRAAIKHRNELVRAFQEAPSLSAVAEGEREQMTPPSEGGHSVEGSSSPPPKIPKEYTEEDLKDVPF